jgi:polyisoprenoid-binding protein YceI
MHIAHIPDTLRTMRPAIAFIVLTAASALPIPAHAQAATWAIDPGHSAAQFAVRHMVVSNVKGQFDGPTGTVTFDPANIAGTLRVEAVIDARTINTRNPDRDKDLRSDAFFDVDRFPRITFKSKRAEAAAAGHLKLTGDLTMHGVTKEVVLDVEGPTAEIKDIWGSARLGASASTVLDRREFGLLYSSLLEGGGAVVGNEVTITIDLEVTREPAKE